MNPEEVFNTYWKSTYFRPSRPLENRTLQEAIFGIIASGVMSFFLLLASKFSNLESDHSRFQIYKRMKKDFAAFNVADKPEEFDITEFLIWEQNVDEMMTKNDMRIFNFLFNPNSEESFLDWHPLQNIDINQARLNFKYQTGNKISSDIGLMKCQAGQFIRSDSPLSSR